MSTAEKGRLKHNLHQQLNDHCREKTWLCGRSGDSPVGVGCDLIGVEFDALAVLLYGLLVLSFLHQGVAFLFQDLAFFHVFIAWS